MSTSGRLILFIFISLILHALFIFISIPADDVIEPPQQTVSVSLKTKAGPGPEPEAAVEALPQPESPPEHVSQPQPEPEAIPEPPVMKEEAISTQNTELSEEPVAAQSSEVQPVIPEAAGAPVAAAVEGDAQPEPAANPFEGLIRRINLLKDSTYPLRAKKRGYQGTVVVELNLDREGRLLSATVFQKCRHSILNNAALELIEKVFERPYPHDTGKDAVLRIPVTYRLR